MAKFRKRPILVDAVQWFPWTDIEGVFDNEEDGTGVHFINTLEGLMEVSPGDWIVTGVKGERYPVKPDIFEITYEKVLPEVQTKKTYRAHKMFATGLRD